MPFVANVGGVARLSTVRCYDRTAVAPSVGSLITDPSTVVLRSSPVLEWVAVASVQLAICSLVDTSTLVAPEEFDRCVESAIGLMATPTLGIVGKRNRELDILTITLRLVAIGVA